MANGAALINEAMWRHDREFRALPRLAQCTFLQLLSQKDLDCAGVLTLHIDLLVKGCDEITAETLWHDLKTLEAARFVFVDADTDELLIRSYVRRASSKSPNAFKSALRAAGMIGSPKLRYELAQELRRLHRADADEVADEIEPSNYHPEPLQTPSESHSEPIGTPSERGIPFEPHPEPPVPVPYPVPSPTVGGYVGEAPPPDRCDKHQNHPDPPPCGGCRRAREARELWDADQAEARAARRSRAREVIDNCDCVNGFIDTDDGAARCPKHPTMSEMIDRIAPERLSAAPPVPDSATTRPDAGAVK